MNAFASIIHNFFFFVSHLPETVLLLNYLYNFGGKLSEIMKHIFAILIALWLLVIIFEIIKLYLAIIIISFKHKIHWMNCPKNLDNPDKSSKNHLKQKKLNKIYVRLKFSASDVFIIQWVSEEAHRCLVLNLFNLLKYSWWKASRMAALIHNEQTRGKIINSNKKAYETTKICFRILLISLSSRLDFMKQDFY